MKTNLIKKCLAVVMMAAMLVTLLPANFTAAEEKAVEQTAVSSGTDITAPTDVSVVSFVENGQTLSIDDEFHLIITAQDTESEISAENSYIYMGIGEQTWHLSPTAITPLEGNMYELTFPVPWSGHCVIRKFAIADTAGNATDVSVENAEGEYLYTFDVENSEVSTILTELTFDKSEVLLDDTVTSVDLNVTAKINRDISQEDNTWMFVELETEPDSTEGVTSIDIRLEYDAAEKVFKGTEKIEVLYQSGSYIVERVSFNGSEITINSELEQSFTINKDFTDQTPPKFTEFYFTKNGERVEAGFTATAEDEIKLYCSFDEEMYFYKDNRYGSVSTIIFRTDASNVSEAIKYIDFDDYYNADTGMYEIPIDVSAWYPSEWYIQSFNVFDKYYNPVNAEGIEYYTYFYIMKDGTCVIPTYDYEVYLVSDEDNQLINTVTAERISTLGELLPDEMPVAPEYDGKRFAGWEYQGSDGWIPLDEKIVVLGGVNPCVYIRPVYETVDDPEETPDTEDNPNPEETPDTETTPDTEVIPEAKPVVELKDDVIEQLVDSISTSTEGAVITIDMSKEDGTVATVVPAEILEAARENNVNIVLDMGDYSWSINSDDILDGILSDINLEVTMDTNAIPSSTVEALANGEATRQLSLTHNGEFRFNASLTLNIGSEYEGEFGNLYYYDSTGTLVFMNAGKIQKDGTVSVSFSHASDYVIIIGEDRTEKQPDTNTVLPPANTTNPTVESPKTGDMAGIVWILFIAAAIFVGRIVKMKKF